VVNCGELQQIAENCGELWQIAANCDELAIICGAAKICPGTL
jgi:hypothetical protein